MHWLMPLAVVLRSAVIGALNTTKRWSLADCEAGVRVKAGGVDQHGNYATMLAKK